MKKSSFSNLSKESKILIIITVVFFLFATIISISLLSSAFNYVYTSCDTPEGQANNPSCINEPIFKVKYHLPHEEKLSDGTQLNIALGSYADYEKHPTEPYLSATLPTCKTSSQLTEAKSLMEQWLSSINLSLSDFHYEISCTYCPLNSSPSGSDLCHLSSDGNTLESFLPYASENFKIELSDNHKLTIILFIDRASPYYPDHTAEAEQLYLKEALSWIKSRGFNPDNFQYETIVEQI